MMKNDFCSSCGTEFAIKEWPRRCRACKAEFFLNPTAVVIILQPVIRDGHIGVAMGRRAIQPAKGQWSLLSGYTGVGETAEDAACREFTEETSLEVESFPRYAYSSYNENNLLMLHFVIDAAMPYEKFLTGKPCPENFELGVYFPEDGIELAFPRQSEFTRRYFAGEFSV